VNFDVQLEGSATVVTEVTGHDMFCGAGYVACRDLSYSEGLRSLCVHIVIYIQETTVKGTAIYRGVCGCREGSVGGAGKAQLGVQGRISWGCREGSVGVQGRISWGAGKDQ
jgi:hypothetical protein